jgi:hypothetical protein
VVLLGTPSLYQHLPETLFLLQLLVGLLLLLLLLLQHGVEEAESMVRTPLHHLLAGAGPTFAYAASLQLPAPAADAAVVIPGLPVANEAQGTNPLLHLLLLQLLLLAVVLVEVAGPEVPHESAERQWGQREGAQQGQRGEQHPGPPDLMTQAPGG